MIEEAERLFPDTVDKIYQLVASLKERNPATKIVKVYNLVFAVIAVKNIINDKTFLIIMEVGSREVVGIVGEPEIKRDNIARALMYLLLKLKIRRELVEAIEKELGDSNAQDRG